MSADILVEACVEDLDTALAAVEGGAGRIELCRALELDGLTPADDLVAALCAKVTAPVRVMVRPRPGNFLYDEAEIAVMLGDIARLRSLGASGIVLGALDAGGGIDMAAMRRFREAADGMPITFHRAFDQVAQPLDSLDRLVELDIATVLTSGGAATAVEGAAMLAAIRRHAAGRIEIMAGGSIRPGNVADIVRATGVPAVHLSPRPARGLDARAIFAGMRAALAAG